MQEFLSSWNNRPQCKQFFSIKPERNKNKPNREAANAKKSLYFFGPEQVSAETETGIELRSGRWLEKFSPKKASSNFFACRRFLRKGKSKTFKAIEHCLELPGPSEHCLELSGPPEQHCLELLGTSEHCLEPIEAHFVALWCKTFKKMPLGFFKAQPQLMH